MAHTGGWCQGTGYMYAEWSDFDLDGDPGILGFEFPNVFYYDCSIQSIDDPWFIIQEDFGYKLMIYADNIDLINPLKRARLQFTYDPDAFDTTPGVSDTFPRGDGVNVSLVDSIVGSEYTTVVYDITWQPNPDWENVWLYLGLLKPGFDFNDGIYQAIFETQCTVPIPGAVWLLGSGFIGLVGIRRKFRQ